ncbi:hypothetical protein M6B38_321995 [Iris pallida]|uniref:Uncharacterized protein n=1 Tax=Iris pallida TaxID=29817 RepID=A0AAX6HBV5_IRIPA|nr:hypothetical protein M6B38_321995 [Iris pallida]
MMETSGSRSRSGSDWWLLGSVTSWWRRIPTVAVAQATRGWLLESRIATQKSKSQRKKRESSTDLEGCSIFELA